MTFMIVGHLLNAQTFRFEGYDYQPSLVKASVTKLDGQRVVKVERDLVAGPFDANNLSKTVDLPTYVRLKDIEFSNGTIEFKMLSTVPDYSLFRQAQGFIGIAFRIGESDQSFESIYLRPKAGRSENQFARNHTVQYFCYPDYKFDRLRKESEGTYETYADVGLGEWITIRLEVDGEKAKLHINNQQSASFLVEKLKGPVTRGGIGLWVDIGTVGYFRDLKIIPR